MIDRKRKIQNYDKEEKDEKFDRKMRKIEWSEVLTSLD